MKFCTIYCRVSSNKQSNYQEGHVSLEVQESLCRTYAEKNGYFVRKVYKDVCSARNMNNQYYLKQMIRKMYKDELILFHDASRFSRNTLQALKCLDTLQKKNISIHSVLDECSYKTFTEKHTFRLLLAKAENESDQISARVKSSVLFRRKRGDYIGNAPYGQEAYKNKDGVRKLRPNKDEQFVIQFICKLVHDNKTYCEIAEKLNNMKIDKRGYTWTNNSIRSVVKSNIKKSLLGFSELKKTVTSLSEEVLDDDDMSVDDSKPKKKRKYNFRKK